MKEKGISILRLILNFQMWHFFAIFSSFKWHFFLGKKLAILKQRKTERSVIFRAETIRQKVRIVNRRLLMHFSLQKNRDSRFTNRESQESIIPSHY